MTSNHVKCNKAFNLIISGVAYGRKQADTAYEIKQELLEKIHQLDSEASKSRKEVETMKLDVDHTRRTLREKREMEKKRFSEEIQFIKRANQQLKQEAEHIMDFGKDTATN